MVEQYDPFEADRPRGILSPRDREFLLGESDIEPASARERAVRSDIRERTSNALLDFVLLDRFLELRDEKQVFQAAGANEPNGVVWEIAYVSMLSMLYRTDKRGDADLESLLEQAIRRGESTDDGDDPVLVLTPSDVDVEITEPEKINLNTLRDKLEQITDGEADMSSLTQNELLLYIWLGVEFEDEDASDHVPDAILEEIANRLNDTWQFPDDVREAYESNSADGEDNSNPEPQDAGE